MLNTKKWYTSKTLWINFIALLAILTQYVTGKDIVDVNVQAALLAIINAVVRVFTEKGLE